MMFLSVNRGQLNRLQQLIVSVIPPLGLELYKQLSGQYLLKLSVLLGLNAKYNIGKIVKDTLAP